MKTGEKQELAADIPELKVVLKEEDSEVEERRPPDKNDPDYNDWARTEAYWAGRNHAGRRSARIAA